MIKLRYVNISLFQKWKPPMTMKKRNRIICSSYFKYDSKVLREGFEYKDIVIDCKRDQGIAIANYLTEQNIPLLSSETLMIQNATEVRLIIHLLRYLKNNN
jgi:hypothetical protein